MSMFFTGASAGTFKYNGVLAGIPATCAVGDLAFITNATAGQQIYECSSTNTWTQQTGGGGGGFTAPTGWAAAANGWSAGAYGLNNTASRTSAGTGTASFWDDELTLTAVSAALGAGDIHAHNIVTTVSGPAQAASTWNNIYSLQTNSLITNGSVLDHALNLVVRQINNPAASTTTTLASTAWMSQGFATFSGTATNVEVMNLNWDANLNGAGTITNIKTLDVGLPGAITGGMAPSAVVAVTAGDPTTAGTPGTSKAAFAVGTPSTAGAFGLIIPASGTYTAPVFLAPNAYSYSLGGWLLGTSTTLNANFTAANTPLQLSGSGACGLGIYNGAMDWFIGENSANNMTIQRPDNGRTDLLIDNATGINYEPNNRAFVASDFTTSGVGTALEAITGLSFALPLNVAQNVSFSCYLVYHQNTANVAVAFGVKNSVAPTQLNALGYINTSTTAFTAANLQGLASTTATTVVSATPSAITTNWNAELHGMIEQPSGAANTVTFLVSTATAGDTVTVKRGSYCILGA